MHLTRFLHLHVVNSTCAHLPKGLYAACLPLISLSTAVEKEDTNPYNISTMEMRSLWKRITYITNHTSPLNWNWVLLRRLISFQRGTLSLCRSTCIKVTYCQSWRFEKMKKCLIRVNHDRVNKHNSIERTSRIFNMSYALSKWSHLYRAYVIGGCFFFPRLYEITGGRWPSTYDTEGFFDLPTYSIQVSLIFKTVGTSVATNVITKVDHAFWDSSCPRSGHV